MARHTVLVVDDEQKMQRILEIMLVDMGLDAYLDQFKAEAHGDDAFEVVLKEAPKPGVLPITATVTAGAEVDLLAGELDLHEAAHTDEPAHEHSWKEFAGWAAGGLAALAALVFGGRRLLAVRQVRAGGAA